MGLIVVYGLGFSKELSSCMASENTSIPGTRLVQCASSKRAGSETPL